jgi:hypothetical protein
MIQQIVTETNDKLAQLRGTNEFTKQVLAVGIEIKQRYTEYLDALLDSDLSQPEGVTVIVDGKKIHYRTNDDFANWLAENMT